MARHRPTNVTRTLVLSGGTLTAVSGTGTIVAGSGRRPSIPSSMAAGSSVSFTFTYAAQLRDSQPNQHHHHHHGRFNGFQQCLDCDHRSWKPARRERSLSFAGTASANSTVSGTVTFFNLGNGQADNVTRTVFLSMEH